MNIENYIESQYRELLSCSQINAEYSDLYKSFRKHRCTRGTNKIK